jgi:hypothetical protein
VAVRHKQSVAVIVAQIDVKAVEIEVVIEKSKVSAVQIALNHEEILSMLSLT